VTLEIPPFVLDIPRQTAGAKGTDCLDKEGCKRPLRNTLFDNESKYPIEKEKKMAGYNIFYIIGVVVVVLFILGYLGLR